MARRSIRWLFALVFITINLAWAKSAVFAGSCLTSVNAPGCAYGLPADQYQALLAVMAANPAPNGHRLPVDADGVKKYTATTGEYPHVPSSFTGMMFDTPPSLPFGWIVKAVRPLLAVVAIYVLVTKKLGARWIVIAWNLFGILDLVIALATGTRFIAPFATQFAASGASVLYLNYVLIIPAYGVPLVGVFHAYSLYQMLSGRHVTADQGIEESVRGTLATKEQAAVRS